MGNPGQGSATRSQAEARPLHWLARVLWYVCAAFPVDCADASLVRVVSDARLSFPACTSSAGSPNLVGWLPSQVVPAIQSWTFRQTYPRAPPIRSALPS